MSGTSLLITSCIIPEKTQEFLALRDPMVRLRQTVAALLSWLETGVDRIVLCDSSTSPIDLSFLGRLAEAKGKYFEFIWFPGDVARTLRYGKGFGEQEIVKHALENSRLIRESSSFYKVTGRIFVSNFDSVVRAHRNHPTVFSVPNMPYWRMMIRRALIKTPIYERRWKNGYIKTVFYKCDRSFYAKHIYPTANQIDDMKSRWFENVIYPVLIWHGVPSFIETPALVGHSGSMGNLYMGIDHPQASYTEAEKLISTFMPPR
jgi:hypothetical protein